MVRGPWASPTRSPSITSSEPPTWKSSTESPTNHRDSSISSTQTILVVLVSETVKLSKHGWDSSKCSNVTITNRGLCTKNDHVPHHLALPIQHPFWPFAGKDERHTASCLVLTIETKAARRKQQGTLFFYKCGSKTNVKNWAFGEVLRIFCADTSFRIWNPWYRNHQHQLSTINDGLVLWNNGNNELFHSRCCVVMFNCASIHLENGPPVGEKTNA